MKTVQIERDFIDGLINRLNEELGEDLSYTIRKTIAVHAHHLTSAVEYLVNIKEQGTSSSSTYYISE